METVTHRMAYGTLATGPYSPGERPEAGGWRQDRYEGDDGHVAHERYLATGPGDTSRPWDKEGRYDSTCPSCWLNIPHTADRHRASIEERRSER